MVLLCFDKISCIGAAEARRGASPFLQLLDVSKRAQVEDAKPARCGGDRLERKLPEVLNEAIPAVTHVKKPSGSLSTPKRPTVIDRPRAFL